MQVRGEVVKGGAGLVDGSMAVSQRAAAETWFAASKRISLFLLLLLYLSSFVPFPRQIRQAGPCHSVFPPPSMSSPERSPPHSIQDPCTSTAHLRYKYNVPPAVNPRLSCCARDCKPYGPLIKPTCGSEGQSRCETS